jgi:hypothetical protein
VPILLRPPIREKVGAQKLARLVGVSQITLGSSIAVKPLVPRASAVGGGARAMMLGELATAVLRVVS